MTLLHMRNVSLYAGDEHPIVSDVNLSIDAGEIVGVIGESGSGKSMTLKTIAGLLPSNIRARGSVLYDGEDVLTYSASAYRTFRDRELGIIYQDPRASVNPVHTLGDFLDEALRVNRKLPKREARRIVESMCRAVGLNDPEHQLRAYPYQFSGGMLQRAVIAAAMITEPRLILADEPTTALDVTRQAEVVALLRNQVRDRGIGMMFITHDLELATAICDRVYVMYRGRIVDHAPAEALHDSSHIYTQALLRARPSLEHAAARLLTIDDDMRARIDAEVNQ